MLKFIHQYLLVLFALLAVALFVIVMLYAVIDAYAVNVVESSAYMPSTETIEVELKTTGPCIETPVVLASVETSALVTENIETAVETKVDTVPVEVEYNLETEVVAPIAEPVSEDDLCLLAHIIYAEAGSDWCSDEMQMYVGSVVLNRVKSPNWPNTMHEVVYQEGQYECVWIGSFYNEPNQRAWDMAQWLLTNGSQLPPDVVYQSGSPLGNGVYIQVGNMYFCYG